MVVLAFGAALAGAVSADVVGWLLAQVLALLVGVVFLTHVLRRLGGVTGDVFGALVELVTAATLVGLAVS